ncbi:Phox homologous domain-containing protein [Nemania sp. NC0429]|nr:Phox homologous domain-containing protein [Nemania sp. NC0429]
MASATDRQLQEGQGNGDVARNKDFPVPKHQPPPSPPVTETDTDAESPSSPLPLPTSPVRESEEGTAHAGITAEESSLPGLGRDGDGPAPRVTTNTDEIGHANESADVHRNPPSPTTSPVTSPPYWTLHNSHESRLGHGRNVSSASAESLVSAGRGITLRDNENSSVDDRGRACWAKDVEVTDYVIVNGSATNIGAFVVWNIRVETLSGSFMNIRKRYSEFDDLRWRLMRTFPGFEAAVPELPPKSVIFKFRPKFLEKRRAGLQYFLHCIMLNPEFSGSPVLKEFLFS